MGVRTIEFRTQTSTRGERVFTVEQENADSFLLDEKANTVTEPLQLTVNEHGPGVYEVSIAREATEAEAAMLANAAFQSMALEDSMLRHTTNVFAVVEAVDFKKEHGRANLYKNALGMTAVAMTRQGDEVIMLGGSAQEVSGNATWTLHDANIFRVAA